MKRILGIVSTLLCVSASGFAAESPTNIKTLVKLDEVDDGQTEWTFDNGQEFPGAKGSLTIVKDVPEKGQSCLKLAGDFTGGGNYVQTLRGLKEVEMKDLAAIRLRVKSDNVKAMSLRLGDRSGQCHQRGGVPIVADGKWHDIVLKPEEIAGGEHWGGANDGKWHGPADYVALIIGPGTDRQVKQPVVYLAGIQAEIIAGPKKDKRVDRILFETAQIGNLLYPEDKRTVKITVVATKPLDDKQKEVSWVVRDYWGAEQGPTAKVALGPPRREGKKYVYDAQIDLGRVALEIGRYYELHADIAREGDEPFHNYTSLAILPKAAAKQYKPEEIPFTSRSWDNRIGECFYLSDRLGVRICGIWGGWSADPPYEPYAPTIELCEKLGMGVLTGSPAYAIEHHDPGWEKYDEKALRQGVRNWIAKYGKVRPLMIDLGNEPPLNPERIRANIAAYKVIYEEVKKIDPSIIVIASSMGPIEEYFQNGFQNYCDVVDFHAYEDWAAIPGTFKAYEKYFAKYGGKKPIWSTEIGLNSQGMVRQAVATTVVKKLALLLRLRRPECLLVRPDVSRWRRQAGRHFQRGPQHLRLPLLPLLPEARRRGLLQHGQRHLHQEVRGAEDLRQRRERVPLPRPRQSLPAGAVEGQGPRRHSAAHAWHGEGDSDRHRRAAERVECPRQGPGVDRHGGSAAAAL